MNHKEIKKCRHTKEKKLFIFGAAVTIIFLLMAFIGSFAREELLEIYADDPDMLDFVSIYYWYVVLLVPPGFFLLMLFMMGIHYGELRGSAVKLDKTQYPEVHALFVTLAQELGFTKIPELYLVNGNGVLNAYATCVPGSRNFAAVYSDIVERCLQNNDMETLRFILGHELGHIKFNHVKWWYVFLTMWMNLKGVKYLFGLPLSRAREYGCDKIGQKLSGDNTGRSLMMLCAGKYAYRDIDMEQYTKEHFDKKSFWSWCANLSQDHGLVSWRIAAVRKNHQAGLIFKNTKSHPLETDVHHMHNNI